MVVRVGVTIKPQHASYVQMRDASLRVEEIGADTLFSWDHFFPLTGDPNGKNYECWTMLGAMESTLPVRRNTWAYVRSIRKDSLVVVRGGLPHLD